LGIKFYLCLGNGKSLSGNTLDFEYPKRVRFICERCAKCCGDTSERVRSILFRRVEAERISQETLKGIDEFAERVRGAEPYVYRMKKTGEGKCVFLKDDSCSIYQIRPLICRFYPFQLKSFGKRKPMFTYTNKCPGIGKGTQLKRSFFEKLFNESAKAVAEDAGNQWKNSSVQLTDKDPDQSAFIERKSCRSEP
jgi:Fe-S-cluster containining protein